jgi:hypothetical protein
MHQSGQKIVAYSSTALSAVAMLGISALVIAAPWIGQRSGAYSNQAKTPAEALALAEVRALAATISGPAPLDQSPAPAGHGTTPSADAASLPPPEWSPVEVGAALMECIAALGPAGAEVIPLAPLRYHDCGAPAPVLLRSLGTKDKIVVDPPLVMNCPMVAALSRWMEKTVQPAARATFGSPVARIMGSSYACRNLYNLPNERRSQHAYANAIDLPAFFLANGRIVNLIQGWGPTRRDLVAGVKLVPIVAKAPEGGAGGVTTADMKTSVNGDAAEAKVVKTSAEPPANAAGETAVPAPKAAPMPDPLAAPEAKFLRRVHRGACDEFTTVLGPEANDVHRSHLHLDLQDRHALNVCQ